MHPKIPFKAVSRVWESSSSGAAVALQRGEPFVWVFPAAESLQLLSQARKSPLVRCSPACVMLPCYAGMTDCCGMRCVFETTAESLLGVLMLCQRVTQKFIAGGWWRGEKRTLNFGRNPTSGREASSAKATSAGLDVKGRAPFPVTRFLVERRINRKL